MRRGRECGGLQFLLMLVPKLQARVTHLFYCGALFIQLSTLRLQSGLHVLQLPSKEHHTHRGQSPTTTSKG